MFQTSGKKNQENLEKNEKNKDSANIQNSSKQNIIIDISQKNSLMENGNLNSLIKNKNLNSINKELENIALTGTSKLSWKELQPFIAYFYEQNLKKFSEIRKNSVESNNNVELNSPLKEIKDEQMDLNNSNEHNLLEEKALNLIDEYHLNNLNNVDDIMKINKDSNTIIVTDEKDKNIEKDIVEFINKINIMPFTIQRIAELLLDPTKYYSTLLKYNRAFYKLVNIDFD